MSQSEKDPNPFSPDTWMEAQRKYWEAWQDMARQASKSSSRPTPGANPWTQGLDQWWNSVSPALPPDAQTFYQHLVDLGRGYFSMAENLMDKQGQTPTDAFKTWMDQVSQSLHSTGLHTGGQDHTRDFMAFWQMPMDTWQRAVSAFAPLPGDMMKGLHTAGPGGFGQDMHEHLDRFLSTPGVGYSRENQAQYQELSRRILEYQRAYQTYQAGMSQVALESMDRFRARMDDAARREQPIASLRELFNEWVDVCEEVYGEHAMSDEYARHYGEIVNALMAVKQQGSMLVDEMLEGFNIPTRNEISTLQQRLQETRRELQRMAREIAAMKQDKGSLAAKPEPEPKAKTKPKTKSAGSAKKAPPGAGKKAAAKPANARSKSVKAKTAKKRS
ncbi:MAG: class III poly(R)-hydroxyalkanoic acid synthase subunit PhaE [Thioalkalivibrio sp.]